MSGIQQWAFSLCCTMVACGLAQLLLPKSGMERMFRLCVSVFFLCCILSPFVLQNPGLRIQLQEYSQEDIQRRAQRLSDTVEQQTNQAASGSIRKIVEEKLQEKGIIYSSITIHINTNGQHEEEPPVVEIVMDPQYQSRNQEITGELSGELGLEVRLGYA